jgi:hypothetical protein
MRSGSVRVSGPLLSERVMLSRGQRLVARVTAGDVRIDGAQGAASPPPAPAPTVVVAAPVPAPPSDAPPEPAVIAPVGGPAKLAASSGGHVRRAAPLTAPLAAPLTAPLARRPLAMQSPGGASAPATGEVPALPALPAVPPAFEPAPLAQAPTSIGWRDRQWGARVVAGEGRAVLADAEALGLDATLNRASGPDLAALADAARYAGRAALAMQALEELRRRFPGTPQAQAAAFLLGREADDRGDTRAGLSWYRRYRAEAPSGPYASEALGREMLAIERLQLLPQAQALAGEYLRRFPNGTYLLRARALLDAR